MVLCVHDSSEEEVQCRAPKPRSKTDRADVTLDYTRHTGSKEGKNYFFSISFILLFIHILFHFLRGRRGTT